MRHLGPLAAAAALLIGGGYGYAVDETVPGIALLSAGLIVLGSWLSLESAGHIKQKNTDDTSG